MISRFSKFRLFILPLSVLQLHCNSLVSLFSEPFPVEEYHLENGLSVYLSVNPKQPVVQTSILINAGSADDPDDATGLAHYLEHLMFKGTSKIGTSDFSKEKPYLEQIESLYETYRQTKEKGKRKQIYEQIDKLSFEASQFVIPNEFSRLQSKMGITDSNAFTSNDRTFYVATVPANQIKNFIQLEWERFRDPVFRTFHTELESVFEERNLRVMDFRSNLFKQYHEIMFPNHPYGVKTPIGKDEDLKNPSLKKIHQFFQENYVPSKMAICMSGNLNPKEVMDEIKITFGSMQTKETKSKLQIPEHKPQESKNTIWVPSKKKIYLFGIKLPKTSPKLLSELNILSLLLSNGHNGLLDESLYYSQKVSSVSTTITEWKDYLILNIWIEPSKIKSLDETKLEILAAFKKIETKDFTDEQVQSIQKNEKLNHIKYKDHNGFRIHEMSEMFLSNWNFQDLQKKFESLNQITKDDLSEFVKTYVNNNIVSIETKQGKENYAFIDKPLISKLEFSKDEESKFKREFSTEPSHSLSPNFADFEQIVSKTYPNGNQFIYQKNKENSLFKFKMIIEKGAWISPYLDISIDYWKHLGTDLYTANALSTKFYLLGSSLSILTNGETLEITMEGEDEQFLSSFRLLEHSIKSVNSSKEVWENVVSDYIVRLENHKEDEFSLDLALHQYALYGKNNLRYFYATPKDLKSFKSSEAVNLLGDLLKYKAKITYYGNMNFDTLENSIFNEYLHKIKPIDPTNLSKKKFRPNKETTFYVLNRKRPHAELNYFATIDIKDKNTFPYIGLFNALYDGLASPYFMAMREQTGNAYAANLFLDFPDSHTDPILWMASLSCQVDKLQSCLSDSKESLRLESISEKRFEEAKLSMINAANTISKSDNYLIDEYIRSQRLNIKEDLDRLVFESIQNKNWKDFLNFTKNISASGVFQISLIGDSKKINRQMMKSFGKVEEVNAETIIGY
ncbi:M16 family metallopeptidase [Leptospira jelokensis]|uniref:M16 family metallopeptidase n=1 Tax=Leptospira jelokensis TaxID=2484931 RepID=UPI001090FA45|nr:insulinase family protein [Leptospira jelokensis]TGM06170.1 insulinase family protein [Leptospira jelokensis]